MSDRVYANFKMKSSKNMQHQQADDLAQDG